MNVVPGRQGDDLEFLLEGLPADFLIDDDEDMARFSRDWSGDHFAIPRAVARPRSTEELSLFMRRCHERRIRVAPQGGLTGLVAGAVAAPDRREIVVSLERMARVRSVNPIDYAMIVEAGCVLETAKRAAEAEQCFLPITFGAQGSCQVGGNVATNAGGFNVLRYGMARDLVLGLEVVLADGRIWNGLRILRKDNRGYDLKQLFIGSEGTLGIVTAIAFKLFPKPTQVETAWVGSAFARGRDGLLRQRPALLQRSAVSFRVDFARRSRSGAARARRPARPVGRRLSGLRADGIVGERRRRSRRNDGKRAGRRRRHHRRWRDRQEPRANRAHVAAIARRWSRRRAMAGAICAPTYRSRFRPWPIFSTRLWPKLRAGLPHAKPVAYGHVGDGNMHLNVAPPLGFPPDRWRRCSQEAEAIIFSPRSTGSAAASAPNMASAG